MPTIEKHTPGDFSWIELATTDQSAAKAFYAPLFNWTFDDYPMGPGEYYTMFLLRGRTVAAAYTLGPDQLANHVPPNWALYVGVTSADETAKRAGELGAKILVPPLDVESYGRMAVIRDPTGAVFSIWQPETHIGVSIKDENASLCWADLSTPDQQSAAAFYSALFGWTVEAGQDSSGYLHIKNGERYIGGIPPAQHRDPNAPPHWLSYFQIASCDESTKKAVELGASVHFGPFTMEGVGRFTVLADPQGAVFSLFQPSPAPHTS